MPESSPSTQAYYRGRDRDNHLKCLKQIASNFSSSEPSPSLELVPSHGELSRDFERTKN